MVSVIALTAGRVVNVKWLRQNASILAVMVTGDVEKAFACVQPDGKEKVVTLVSLFNIGKFLSYN